MNSSASGVSSSLLDLPDKILIKIILYFDARERLTLAKSCKRFNNLVFGDEELLRKLDFTGAAQLTSETDIQQYFNDENTYKKILRINTEQVWAANGLRDSIGKATNLVALNIMGGMRLRSVEELGRFLDPLIHLKRLSLDWPTSKMYGNYDDPVGNKVLEKPFGRLTYLSLEISWYSKEFLLILHLCQQLEELRMLISIDGNGWTRLHREPMKLRNLNAVRFYCQGNPGPLKNDFMGMVPNPAEWTDIHLVNAVHEGYLERNVEVCKELSQLKKMPLPKTYSWFYDASLFDLDYHLISENLLSEAIRLTHEDAPEKFCCLTWPTYADRQPCLLKIDEAKKLLKDPGYPISYLHFSHVIERNCDAHLVASAFPKLTTLVISRLSNENSDRVSKENETFRRRLRKKGSMAPEEFNDPTNPDSSFEMLIENTPHLKTLMISSIEFSKQTSGPGYRALDALYLIPRWKNLTSIRLCRIPVKDGKFLIEIGKGCTKLEEVVLQNLGSSERYSYESELWQMLQHCRNLKKLSIRQSKMENISELFNRLANNSKLCSISLDINQVSDSPALVPSVEKMIRKCSELNKFRAQVSPYRIYAELELAVKRIFNEVHRQNFQVNPGVSSFDNDDNASDAFFSSPLVPFPLRG